MKSHEKREKEMQKKAPISGDKNVFIDTNDFTPLTCLGENDKSARIQVNEDENMQVEVKTLEVVSKIKRQHVQHPLVIFVFLLGSVVPPKCTLRAATNKLFIAFANEKTLAGI